MIILGSRFKINSLGNNFPGIEVVTVKSTDNIQRFIPVWGKLFVISEDQEFVEGKRR